MQQNQNEDLINLEELLRLVMKSWKAFVVIFLVVSVGAFLYLNLTTPLYKASIILYPAGNSSQSTNALLSAFTGSFSGGASVPNNADRIKVYASSSEVWHKVLIQLDPQSLSTIYNWMGKKYFGLIDGASYSAGSDLKPAALKLGKSLVIESPPVSSTAISISIETPSAEISKKCLNLLIEEIRDFHNKTEEIKRDQKENFFQKESKKYREKMLNYSLSLSKVSNTQSGLIELTPEDLDLVGVVSGNIRVTPQVYFEYKTNLVEMYKTFAKSLEQNFQSTRIDEQNEDLLFDLVESPYGGSSPSSPNVFKTFVISIILIMFVFSFYILVVPTLKSILFEKKNS